MASRHAEHSGETCPENAPNRYSSSKSDILPKGISSQNVDLNETDNFHSSCVCDDVDVKILPRTSCSKEAVENLRASEDDKKISISKNCQGSEAHGDTMSSAIKVNDSKIVGADCGEKTENSSSNKPSSENLDSSGIASAVNGETGSQQSHPNVKSKPEEDNGDVREETPKCADEAELVEGLVEVHDVQDPPFNSASGDENEESDNAEQDVCDICGDVGREDLLAICSRCRDGAEHTYCMREMLDKVPEGDWLCEECKIAEEAENQKQASDAEGKRATKNCLNTQVSGKRPAEVGVASTSKRHISETSTGSPKISSPSRAGVLSRDNSFRNMDKGKVRPAPQASFGNHFTKNNVDSPRSPGTGSQNTSKGMLSKSNSFSILSKPKVKLVDDVVPHKQKGSKEHAWLDKERSLRAIGKSMSFKSSMTDRSSSTEPKVKYLSSKNSIDQDSKELKRPRERFSFEGKKLSRSDRPLVRSMKSTAGVSSSKVDQKVMPHGETTSSKSTSHMGHRASETEVRPVGVSSTDGLPAFAEKRFNQSTPKDEPSSSSRSLDKEVNNADRIMHNGLPQCREPSSQGDKGRETTLGHSKQSLTTSSRSSLCQKCKDVGHDTESCPIDSPRACDIDTSSVRGSGDEPNRSNNLKAAITAAMLKKPGIYMRRQLERSDDVSKSNVELKSVAASRDQSSPPGMISTEGTEAQAPLQDSDSIPPGKPTTKDLLMRASAALLSYLKMSTIPEPEHSWQGAFEVHRGGKLPVLCGGLQAHLSTSASPKVVETVNKFPQQIQLSEVPRLSTWPTQFHESGVKEVNIALYFFAKDIERNSYEKNYKILLDNMMKNELALKGDIDGVELLIFPSNQLPENCQRWNMLFYLWGVFRGRRVIGLDHASVSSKNLFTPSLDVAHMNEDLPPAILTYSENVSSAKPKDEGPSCVESGNNIVLPCKSPASIEVPVLLSSTTKDVKFDAKTAISQKCADVVSLSKKQDTRPLSCSLPGISDGSVVQSAEKQCTNTFLKDTSVPECPYDAELKPSVGRTGATVSDRVAKMPVHRETSHDVQDSSYGLMKSFPYGIEEAGVVVTATDKIMDLKDEEKFMHNETWERDTMLKEPCYLQLKRKYPHVEPTKTIVATCSGTDRILQQKEVNDMQIEGDSLIKRLKTGISGSYVSNSAMEEISLCDIRSGSSAEGNKLDNDSNVKSMCKDYGTSERFFFPVDSVHESNLQLESESMQWKARLSENEGSYGAFPSLELALGAESKARNKGILPLAVGVTNNKNDEKPPDKPLVKEEEEEEGLSASLSLSLSFPFPEGEQTAKPVAKQGQLLGESRHMNTSLLLFGGLPKNRS